MTNRKIPINSSHQITKPRIMFLLIEIALILMTSLIYSHAIFSVINIIVIIMLYKYYFNNVTRKKVITIITNIINGILCFINALMTILILIAFIISIGSDTFYELITVL